MTTVRLSEKDVDGIIALYERDFSDGWNKQMLLSSFLSGRFFCLGTFIDGVLAGVITVTVGLDDADIEGVVTDRNFRRKGVADALVKNALEEIRGAGVKKVLLEVRANNTPAIELYLKHGFSRISVRKKYYPDGEDALILIKEI